MADLNVGRLTFDVVVNDGQFTAGLKRSEMAAATSSAKTSRNLGNVGDAADKTGKQVAGLGASFNKAAIGMAAFAAGAVAFRFLQDSVAAASDLNEAIGLTNDIFKDNSAAIQEWAKTGADAFGLSTTQALSAAAGYANLFQNVGLSMDDASAYSQRLVELSADMASAFNTSVPDAIQAISAGLRGEAEPLRRYGVMLEDATLKAKAMELGLYSGSGSLTQYAKSQAAYNIILEKTSAVQGNFAKTADDPANAARRLEAEVTNLQAALGEELLPVMRDFLGLARDTVKWVGENQEAVMRLVKTAALIGGLALAWKGVAKAAEMAASMQALAASGGMRGRLGKLGKVGAGAVGLAVAGTAASMATGGDLVNFGSTLDDIEDPAQRAAAALQGVLDPTNLQKGLNFAEGLVDAFVPVTRMLETEQATIADFDAQLTALWADGKTAEAQKMFGDLTVYAERYGLSLDQVKSMLPGYTTAVEASTQAVEDQADAAGKGAAAQDKFTAATERSKDAVKAAMDAAKAYRRAVRETSGDVLGGVDAFGGNPMGKDALGQEALLSRSAGSRDYMKQTAADMKTLASAGVSQATIDGLYEVEQTAPGTIRRIVSQGITKPFVQQLNKDFADREKFSRIIARSLVVSEKDAMWAAKKTAQREMTARIQAYREAESTMRAGMSNGSIAFGSPEWAAGNRADIAGNSARAAGVTNAGGWTVRQMNVYANDPTSVARAAQKNTKVRNSAGRRG